MEKPGTLFPRSFGSFLFPLLATMHAGDGSGDDNASTGTPASANKNQAPAAPGGSQTQAAGEDQGGSADGNTGGVSARGGGRAVRSADERLALVARSYGRAMCELAGTPDPEGHALLQAALAEAAEAGGEARRREEGGREGEGGAAGSGDGQQERRGKDGGAGGGADLMELMEKTRRVFVRLVGGRRCRGSVLMLVLCRRRRCACWWFARRFSVCLERLLLACGLVVGYTYPAITSISSSGKCSSRRMTQCHILSLPVRLSRLRLDVHPSIPPAPPLLTPLGSLPL